MQWLQQKKSNIKSVDEHANGNDETDEFDFLTDQEIPSLVELSLLFEVFHITRKLEIAKLKLLILLLPRYKPPTYKPPPFIQAHQKGPLNCKSPCGYTRGFTLISLN